MPLIFDRLGRGGLSSRPMATNRKRRSPGVGLALVGALLAPTPAGAEIVLSPGFTALVYVTGDGFGTSTGTHGRGVPGTATLAVDHTGALYMARTGRRYSGGEFEYLSSMYRIPVGGARV